MTEPSEELLATIATTDWYRAHLPVARRAGRAFSLEGRRWCSRSARSAGRSSAGRRPLGAEDDELLVAPPGLYTQPALEHDDLTVR